jgi:multidrug efflux pump subunit AcrA (membrane-fusion protein)
MTDSNFLSGELVTTNITKNTNLVPITKETIEDKGGTLVHFPQAKDYALVESVSPDDLLPSLGRSATIGGTLLVGMFLTTLGLSTILKYKVTVQAAAAIRPQGELRLVQSTIEGSILSLPVRENQTVQPGDIIATVKDGRLESKLQTKRYQLVGDIAKAKQQIAGIDTQIVALDRQGVAEREQIDRAIAGMQAEYHRAERDYRDKQIISQTEVAEAEANARSAQREQEAAAVEIVVAEANLKSIQSGYQAAVTRSQRYQGVAQAGAISQNQLEEAQLSAQQQAQSIVAQRATIQKQQQIVARLAESVTAATARIERTQAALNPSRAELELIRQKIAREQANGQAAIARLRQEREKLLQQRVEILNQIATSQKEIAQIATELQPTVLRAPIAGTVQELNLRNLAQVVRPGDIIAQIVPLNAPLQIKALVSAGDIDQVKVGQTVQMRVSACPYTDRGVLGGKVTQVSADAKAPDKNTGENASQRGQNGVTSMYEVVVKPDTLTLGTGATQCQIRSGMEGRAEIISKEETVFQFMLRKARLLVSG